MVDVVVAKAGADELLEEISLFVAALGRPEPGERRRAVAVADPAQRAAGEIESLFPGRFAKDVHDALGIHREVAALRRRVGAADERRRQPVRVVRIVEAVAALDAQARVVGRVVAALDEEDAVVLDVVGELAADAAERAERLDLLVDHGERDVARRHQRAGRARLHAFAAGDARRRAHRVVHVEDDLRALAAERQADDVVDLLVAAGANAARALDAGVEVDRHRRVRQVLRHRRARRKARLADAEVLCPGVELAVPGVRGGADVGQQKFEDELLRLQDALALRRDLHPGGGRAAARRREDALAVDLDHARAAVSGEVESFLVAKARDRDAFAVGDLEQRLAGARGDFAAVELEGDRRPLDQRRFGASDGVHGVSCAAATRRCAASS